MEHISRKAVESEMARQADKTRKAKLNGCICEEATKMNQEQAYQIYSEQAALTQSLCCASNLELSWRVTDKTMITSWWKGAINGMTSWDLVSNYLHGAQCFCDEALNKEIEFLRNIVNGYQFGIWNEFDWHEDD